MRGLLDFVSIAFMVTWWRHMLMGHMSYFDWLDVGTFLDEVFGFLASWFLGEAFKCFSLSSFSLISVFFIFAFSPFLYFLLSLSSSHFASFSSGTIFFFPFSTWFSFVSLQLGIFIFLFSFWCVTILRSSIIAFMFLSFLLVWERFLSLMVVARRLGLSPLGVVP